MNRTINRKHLMIVIILSFMVVDFIYSVITSWLNPMHYYQVIHDGIVLFGW